MTDNRKKYLKEGSEVAHKEALSVKMEVRKIIWRVKKGKQGDMDRRFLLGIECGWWNNGTYNKEVFHTHTLVPWEIAEEGHIAVIKYLDSLNNVGK